MGPWVETAVFSALWLIPGRALGQDRPTLSGTWTASAMTESWSTTDWGEGCGPKPTSSGGAPGGSVTIAEQGGELAFSGAGRAFTTAQCWEQMPGMSRTSHSASPRGWRTRCTSPAGDPRRAVVTTTIGATDDSIIFSELGTYESFIQDSACKASVSRSRTFKLVQRAGAAAASASATPSAAPSAAPPPPTPAKTAEPAPAGSSCDEVGPPARFEVRPTRKLLRPLESFKLKVVVTDAKGCAVGAEPEVRVTDAGALEGMLEIQGLEVTAAADAPAGTATLRVALAGKVVPVLVEVATEGEYAALLAQRGLNASGEDDRAGVAEIAGGIGGAATTAEDSARARRISFIAIVAGIAALLGLAALVMMRRGKRALTDDESDPPSEPTGEAIPAPAASPEPAPETAVAPAATRPRKKRAAAEKICPTCGELFPDEATFCGTDGTQLVPVN